MSKSLVRVKAAKFSKGILNIRLWEERHLPLSQSRIAFDLFALIAHSSSTGKQLNLKELFSALKYSERGVRYVLEQFIEGGWCEVICDDTDKRCRLIIATQRFKDAFESYQKVVLAAYMGCFERDK